MSSTDKPHFLARKFQDLQRSTARGYICPVCSEAFQAEPKLWQHAKSLHPNSLGYTEEAQEADARKQFRQEAIDRAQKTPRKSSRPTEPIPSKPSSKDDDSTRPNFGDDIGSSSPSRPTSAPAPIRDPEKEIHNIDKLAITQDSSTGYRLDLQNAPLLSIHSLKHGAGVESGPPESPPDVHKLGKTSSAARHGKALSGGPFIGKDPDFDREAIVANDATFQRNPIGPAKRLFDPNIDDTGLASSVRKSKHQEHASSARRNHDPTPQTFRSKQNGSDPKKDNSPQRQFRYNAGPLGNSVSLDETASADLSHENNLEQEPIMIPQPETRPISHDQLVVEVKGIYAGLVMVETKCIEVDEAQSAAAQDKDTCQNKTLSNEQWQALIALHKQLLHEHHDFFLASQHPSASPALSRLAAKYSMPARMWRHGIHAFLEVLRHRLPESLDHMLAFIYIAYSMMALLYETVSTFEDTWIECLGDLARYRMAIEDDDIRDREVWSGVARFWYSKAADASPNVGRLYHHLAILARPSSLQQLSLYAKSLTCIIPFESARGSIMTVFSPVLNGRESAYHRSSSLENVFIRSHGILFTGRPHKEFDDAIRQLKDGLLDSYIGRVTAKFKEQGVFAAVTNIAALFEYGAVKQRGIHKSLFRLAFDEIEFHRRQKTNSPSTHFQNKHFDVNNAAAHPAPAQSDQPVQNNLTASDIEFSEIFISRASSITFATLSISLQRIGDKNVFPLVHVSFVFLWSLAIVEKAMKYVERDIPWGEICSYLNTLAKPEAMTPRVWGEGFPKPSDGVGRPLPEDYILRGQVYSQDYFPRDWFQELMVDDEERTLELPSMAAPRVERILWLGMRIASFNRWIKFSKESHKFNITQYSVAFQTRQMPKMDISLEKSAECDNHDIAMSDVRPAVDVTVSEYTIPKRQANQYPTNEQMLTNIINAPYPEKDITMTDTGAEEVQPKNPQDPVDPDTPSWLSAGFVDHGTTPSPKKYHQNFISDSSKHEAMVDFDTFEAKDPFKL